MTLVPIDCFQITFKKADGNSEYFFDCICTLSVTIVIAFVWRDVWVIVDVNLFPGESELSAYASIVS